METRTSLMLCVVAVLALAWATSARAGVIYYDDFDGSGSADLHGTTPDITPAGETWTAASAWKDNGYNGNWGAGYEAGTLPFVPATGQVYTLSAVLDVNPLGSEPYHVDYIGMNFGGGPGVKFQDVGSGPYGTGTGKVYTTGGPSADVYEADYGSGAISVDIVLDTQPALWEVEWKVNGSSVRGPEAYAANPTITTVTIWKDWMAGSVDDLTLTPEPATLALLGLGGLGLLLGRKRR